MQHADLFYFYIFEIMEIYEHFQYIFYGLIQPGACVNLSN